MRPSLLPLRASRNIVIITLAVFLVALSTFFQIRNGSDSHSSNQDFFDQGLECFSRRSWERTQHFMQQAYAAGQKTAGYYLALALQALHKDHTENGYSIPMLLEPLAIENHIDSQRELGFYYLENDSEKALYWLKKAADSGDKLSQCRLDLLTIEDQGFKNCEVILDKISHVAEDSMPILYHLGVAQLRCNPENDSFLVSLEKAANLGYFPAQEHLGRLYFYPNPWVQKNSVLSKQWLEKAASHGYTPAMYQLGLWHFSNDIDNSQALHWIERAALKGHKEAQFFMGRHAEQNFMPQKDWIVSWYQKSAEQNHLEAANRLGILHAQGVYGIDIDYPKSHYYFSLAAEKGYAPSQNNLGLLYFYHVLEKDNADEKAKYWFEQAAAQGHYSAIHNLNILYSIKHQ